MAKFKVEKTKDYTIMSNYHLKEKNMSLKAKGLLSVMLSLPDNWDYSIAGLVAISQENETAIKSALSELKQFGYLEVTKLMPNESETGRIDYIYNVYEKPKQEGEKQEVENLPLEILDVENQGQLNTNNKILNNKSNNMNIISTINNNGIPIGNREENSKEENSIGQNKQGTIYDFLQKELGRTLSSTEIEKVKEWEDNELTRYAVKVAILNGAYTINYIDAIIYNWQKLGIKSVSQAQEETKRHRDKKISKKIEHKPEWFDDDIKKEEVETNENNEMEELLKDFK